MTFEEANKNSRSIFTRNNLQLDEVVKRLGEYFEQSEIEKIISDCKAVKTWTDGTIAVVYFRDDDTFTIVASGIYMELIKP